MSPTAIVLVLFGVASPFEDEGASPLDAAIDAMRDVSSAERRMRGARDATDLGGDARDRLRSLLDPRAVPDSRVRALAIDVLSAKGRDEREIARSAAEDPAWDVREAAVRGLPRRKTSIEPLLRAAKDPIYVVRRAAVAALSRLADDARASAAIDALADDPDPDVRAAALRASLPRGAPRVLECRARAAGDVPREAAATAIALGEEKAIAAALEEIALSDPDSTLKLLAADRLARLGGETPPGTVSAALDAALGSPPSAASAARRVLARFPAEAGSLALERLSSGQSATATALALLIETVVSARGPACADDLGSLLRGERLDRGARLAIRRALGSLPGGLGLEPLRAEIAAETDPAERLRLVESFALRADDALASGVLSPALDDPSRTIRLTALSRLVVSGRRDLLSTAVERLEGTPDENVLRRFLRMLPRLDPDEPARFLAPLLAHGHAPVREEALVALGGSPRASEDAVAAACERAIGSETEAAAVRLAALNVLSTRCPKRAAPLLRRVAGASGDGAARLLAIQRLGALGRDEDVPPLAALANDRAEDAAIRHAAIRAIGAIPGAAADAEIEEALARPEERAVAIRAAASRRDGALSGALLAVARDGGAPLLDRVEAIESLGRMPAGKAPLEVIASFLESATGHEAPEIASAAVRALGDRGDERAWPLLEPLLLAREGGEPRADRADLLSAAARLEHPAALERLLDLLASAGEEPDGEEFRAVLGALMNADDEAFARRLLDRAALPPGDAERISLPEASLEAIARERRRGPSHVAARAAHGIVLKTFPPDSVFDRRAAAELAEAALRDGDLRGAARFAGIEAGAGAASGEFAREEDPFAARFPSEGTSGLASLYDVIVKRDPASFREEALDAVRRLSADGAALLAAERALFAAGENEIAAAAAEIALDIDPSSGEALLFAARADLALGREDRGVERLERLLFLRSVSEGSDPGACLEVATRLLLRGERGRGLAFLREAAIRDPSGVEERLGSGVLEGLAEPEEIRAILAPYRR